uniref:AAA family ATPase n=1 Tax=Kocuria sp. TaxID=1871328 RepID=UPI0037C0AB0D
MIEEIHIHDLGVITDAVLPLGPGLSILSGETGAGKTMVVTALGMLLGNRADAGSVRSGSTKALAEATVRVPSDHAAVALVEESGGAVDSETVNGTEESLVLLSRTVSAEGRSRAHVGGRSAPVGTLGAVGETLVAVHGQSDQLRLKSPAAQRTALDDYAGADVAEELATYRGKLARYREVVATLRAAKENSRERALQAQALTTALEEIDAVEPVPGEDAQLDAESEKLTNLEALRGAALSAHGALSGSDADDEPDLNAVALLSHAHQALDLVAESDPELVALATRVRELTVVAADVASDLSGYASGLDEDG